MFEDQLELEYFNWLVSIVCNKRKKHTYSKLFELLYSIEFTWSIPLDANRAADGIDLRSTFSDDMRGFNKPCNVLEMIIGLAKRIEDSIMGDGPDDNTPYWFWEMLKNLGIDAENDINFDGEYVTEKIEDWLSREFDGDGMGSLFRVKDAKEDMRDIEIWSQMCYWLNENY